MAGSIIDVDKLQNEQFIKKERKLICSKCGAELNFKMTDKEYSNRFYFNFPIFCLVCGVGNMYKVK
jgi:hypothetical protein